MMGNEEQERRRQTLRTNLLRKLTAGTGVLTLASFIFSGSSIEAAPNSSSVSNIEEKLASLEIPKEDLEKFKGLVWYDPFRDLSWVTFADHDWFNGWDNY